MKLPKNSSFSHINRDANGRHILVANYPSDRRDVIKEALLLRDENPGTPIAIEFSEIITDIHGADRPDDVEQRFLRDQSQGAMKIRDGMRAAKQESEQKNWEGRLQIENDHDPRGRNR